MDSAFGHPEKPRSFPDIQMHKEGLFTFRHTGFGFSWKGCARGGRRLRIPDEASAASDSIPLGGRQSNRADDPASVEARPVEDGGIEACVAQIAPDEAGAAEIGAREIGGPERYVEEFAVAQVGAGEIDAIEFHATKLPPTKPGLFHGSEDLVQRSAALDAEPVSISRVRLLTHLHVNDCAFG